VISDGPGSTDEAGPDRSDVRLPIVVCLADTDGSDGRALAGELAKARHTPTASSGIVVRLADGNAVAASTSRTDKGVMSVRGVLTRRQQLGPGGGMALTRMVAKRLWDVWPISYSAGPGGYDGLPPFDCPEPFPFYVARIDDRLLQRPTPEGVRLARNFCKIRFRFVWSWRKIEFCKIFGRADRSRSAVSSCAIGNGPEQPKETEPWPPRSQP
jgi:hypothetical protein